MASSTAKITISEPSIRSDLVGEPLTTHVEIHPALEVLGENGLGLAQSGSCWHPLFQNPVIVQGYPILARMHNEKGLEISMDLMVGLGAANYLTDFDGIPVLKGFSSMFIATGMPANSIVWHFVCNRNGDRVSYLNVLRYHSGKTGSSAPEPSYGNITRNFIGWTSSVRRLAGKYKEESSLLR
jgi:hypothetical protein